MKKLVVLVFCLVLSQFVLGSNLILLDSVGIEKVGDKTFIIHQVDEKETVFGISRRYQVAISDILQNNTQLQEGLKIGQRIKIPYITKAAIPEGAKLHKVAPGETLFAISKQYNVPVSDLMAWNNLQGNDISVGQALILQGVAAKEEPVAVTPAVSTPTKPADKSVAKSNEKATAVEKNTKPAVATISKTSEPENIKTPQPEVKNTDNTAVSVPGEWVTHTVAQGETLFSIAQKYQSKIEDVISWNALTSNNLSTGQKLKVGREPAGPSKVPVVKSTVPIVVNNEKTTGTLSTPSPDTNSTSASTEYKNIKESGLAEVIEGTSNHKKYLVLHREAPVGTIMRIRNEENDVTIFARVVGKIPDSGDNGRLTVKVSKAAFDQLRAVNSRFRVEISY